jgi:hypothetical protein
MKFNVDFLIIFAVIVFMYPTMAIIHQIIKFGVNNLFKSFVVPVAFNFSCFISIILAIVWVFLRLS